MVPGTPRADVIKVGVDAELTGDVPAVGASCKNAAELAVAEINDAGGLEVGGKKHMVQLTVEDNASKADQAASAAQKLITQDNELAIIGPIASRYAIPASEIAESSKVLLDVFKLTLYAEGLAKNLPYGLQRRLEIARALAIRRWGFPRCS